MLWLFLSEFSAFLQTDVRPELLVDTSRGEKLKINFDITFPRMACACTSTPAHHPETRLNFVGFTPLQFSALMQWMPLVNTNLE